MGRQARGVFKDQLVEGLFPQSGLRTVLLSNRRVNRPIGPARFVDDSLEEGDGFEPSVPVAGEPVYIAEGELRGDRRAAKKIWRGTDGSNPSPSTRESDANLSFRVGTSSMPGNAAALVFFLFDLLHLDGEDLCPPI